MWIKNIRLKFGHLSTIYIRTNLQAHTGIGFSISSEGINPRGVTRSLHDGGGGEGGGGRSNAFFGGGKFTPSVFFGSSAWN